LGGGLDEGNRLARRDNIEGARCQSEESKMERQLKIIVEKHSDGYVAYPLGLKGVVVGEGDTYEEALADVKSAIRFHVETFGKQALEGDEQVLEAFVAETGIAL
jgi:predicted RNase H-like HicB family nuclease